MTDSTKPPSGPDGGVPEVVPPRLTGEGADTPDLPDAMAVDPSRVEPEDDELWAARPSDEDLVGPGGGGEAALLQEVMLAEQEASLEGGGGAGADEAREGELDVVRSHLKGLIEALIFASDKPITPSDIAKTAKADRKAVVELLRELQESYLDRGIRLVEVAGGYAFRTAPAFGPFVRDVTAQRPVKMTRAQLETLAIVAYRQPLTRPEIDDVRGVDSGPVLKMLLERGLVRILGKRDEPGRPLIYGTTSAFLSFFNLKSLKDLPSLREFTELSDDSKRTFEKVLGEEAPVQLDFGEAISGRNDTGMFGGESGELDGEAGMGSGAESGLSDGDAGSDSGAESGSGSNGLNDGDAGLDSGAESGSDGLGDEEDDDEEDDDEEE